MANILVFGSYVDFSVDDFLSFQDIFNLAEVFFYIFGNVIENNELNELILSCKYDISELCEILFDEFSIKLGLIEQLSSHTSKHLIIAHELAEHRIDDARVV